jgi:ParB family transcriptional regulator, chromosome partitioning protein
MRQLEKRRASTLKKNPYQIRKNRPDIYLRTLGESVITKQIHPLVIRPDGTIIDGDGRHLGVMMLDPNFELECISTDEDLTPAQIIEIQLVTALHRSGLSGYEQYLACKNWTEITPGGKLQDLAVKIGRDPGMVTKLMSLSDCIDAVKEAAAAGLLGVSDWYSISKVPEDEQLRLLAAKLNGSNRNELARQSTKIRNGNKPDVKVHRLKIDLSSGITVTVAGKGITLDGAIDATAEAHKVMERGRRDGLTAATITKVAADRAAKVGKE